MMQTVPRPLLILGPTAGGKSELAVCLAERMGEHNGAPGEIISADSMQIYRHMNAGTAKPPRRLQQRAKHHLIDIAEPTERFTAADWLAQADTLIQDLQQRGSRPIVVGGTNLYIQSLLEGMFEGPRPDDAFRTSLDGDETTALHKRLIAIDVAASERIKPNDRRRIVRALEVYHLTGKPISAWQQQWSEGRAADGAASPAYRHDPLLIGLRWEPEQINPRINLRVKAMFYPEKVDATLSADVLTEGENLIDETQRLETAGLLGMQAREALGYKQVLAAFRGEMSIEDAYERTKIQTRRFAKQQRTWMKRFAIVQWLDAAGRDADDLAHDVLKYIKA